MSRAASAACSLQPWSTTTQTGFRRLVWFRSSIGTDEVMNRAMKIVENLGASDVQYLMSLKSIKMGQTLSSEMPSKTNITSTSTITNMTKSEAALLKNQKLKIATWLADIHVYKRVYGFVFHAAYDTLKYVTTHVAPDRNSNPTSQGGYSNQVPGIRCVPGLV